MDPLNKEKYRTFNKLGQWAQTNDRFWEDINQYLDNVNKLEFYGGEPLLIAKHFEILEKCIEKDVAKKITLSYNTNGSIYPTKHVELWKHFKHVELFFSLDDTYERFNYIRHPGNFEEVIENLIKFKNLSLDKNNGNYTLGIFQTISIFNILDLDELTKYAHEHLGIPIHYNMVFTPNHISPKVLPKAVKQFISNKYKYHPEYIQRTLNFMNGEDYHKRYWRRFIQITKFSDQYRSESFPETFPQLYALIKEDWDDGI
jgi:MoaA/NifB/PqqE/SkfB family radical SAM enzyme